MMGTWKTIKVLQKAHYLTFLTNTITKQKSAPIILFLAKGNKNCYWKFRAMFDQIKNIPNLKCVLYEKQRVDIGYHLIKNKIDKLTYLSHSNYESVQWSNYEQNKDELLEGRGMEEQLCHFLRYGELKIINTYLDNHPFESYLKMARYLSKEKRFENQHPMLEYFRQAQLISISQEILEKNKKIKFLDYLDFLRKQYLVTQKVLKLKKLERKRQATQDEKKKGLQEWVKMFDIGGVKMQEKQDFLWKTNFIMNNLDLCKAEECSIDAIMDGKGQKQFYATWKQ